MSAIAPQKSFSQKIEREFIEGSAIAPELFQAAIRLATDIEVGPGGEVKTPIHNALNWNFSRFGHQAQESLEAALLLNENSSCWQAKLSKPRFDQKKEAARRKKLLRNTRRFWVLTARTCLPCRW